MTRSISCRVTRRENSAIPASVTPAMARVTATNRRRRLMVMALPSHCVSVAEDGGDERRLSRCGVFADLGAFEVEIRGIGGARIVFDDENAMHEQIVA